MAFCWEGCEGILWAAAAVAAAASGGGEGTSAPDTAGAGCTAFHSRHVKSRSNWDSLQGPRSREPPHRQALARLPARTAPRVC